MYSCWYERSCIVTA